MGRALEPFGCDRGPADMTPRDALRLATRGGAEVLGRAHDIGQIRAGFCADLAAGGSMAAVAHRAWYEIPDTEGFWHVYADQGDEPDFTGDGLPDLTLSHSSDHNEVLVISGGIPAGAMNDDVHARITSDELSGMPLNQPVADMDGDGVPEIMIGLDMLESTVLRAGGTLDLDTYPHFRFDNYDVPLLMAATDLTGDHRSEFVFVDTQWDIDNTGVKSMRTLFIEGFDLPWDDPSKW